MNGRTQRMLDDAAERSELLHADVVDSAISHCEKLRRVLELEQWIAASRDNTLLISTCRAWQAEREQLLAELDLTH
jgi:hypothetical protein